MQETLLQKAQRLGIKPSGSALSSTSTETLLQKAQRLGIKPAIVKNPANQNNSTFTFTGKESPIEAGFKAAGNLPSSFYNLGKGIVKAAVNPIDTITGVANVAAGGIRAGAKAIGITPTNTLDQQKADEAFGAFAKVLKGRYGSLDALQKTAVEDPAGFATDILSVIGGGASLLGKGATVSNAISKVSKVATTPVSKVAGMTSSGIKSTARYATSQATGLNPETITTLVNNPKMFKGVTPEVRIETANVVKNALDTRLNELSGLGKEYQVLRDSRQVVTIPKNTISSVLNKYGIKLGADNKLVTSAESRPVSLGDRVAIQEFIDNYGNQRVLSTNAFLNTREALSNLAKYDTAKTNISTALSRELRYAYDQLGKKQIKGLDVIDTQYAPERQLLGQLKKDIFTPQGELKDNAISKIASVTGKGKENLLARMKEIVPDIEQRVNVIKAVEDIQRASGTKTGTYIRSIITGGGVFTGNVPVIVGAILTQPKIASALLRGYGLIGKKAEPILNAIKTIANDVNNFRLPKFFLDEEGGLNAGLSVKRLVDLPKKFRADNIAKLMDKTDDAILSAYIKNPNDTNEFMKMTKLAEDFGINAMNIKTDQLERFMMDVAAERKLIPTELKVNQ
jgi:hypothetical protein